MTSYAKAGPQAGAPQRRSLATWGPVPPRASCQRNPAKEIQLPQQLEGEADGQYRTKRGVEVPHNSMYPGSPDYLIFIPVLPVLFLRQP